jgi:Secretion system C-terminal sorting domain
VDGTPFDIYYFRVKSINTDAPSNYSLEFYSTPFVVSRFKDTPLAVNKVYPSPFTDFVGVLFTGIVQEDVEFQLYDVAGRLVSSEKLKLEGIYHEIKTGVLPKGIYLLSVKIGNKKGEAFKIFGGSN